jgi:lipopolysaccharide export system protein LptA
VEKKITRPQVRSNYPVQQRLLLKLKRSGMVISMLCIFFILKPKTSLSQNTIQIDNANSLEYVQTPAAKIRKLIGDVQMRQNDMRMTCDSAYMYLNKNNVDAMGHVHIIQGDTLNIYSKRLKYFGNTHKAILNDSVRLVDPNMTITTDVLNYNTRSHVATYFTGGTLKNDSSTLTSKHGYYYGYTKDAFFKYDVKLVQPSFTLTADTLRFNSATKISYFLGPTHIVNDSGDVIYCEGGFYDTRHDSAFFTKHASFTKKAQKLLADSINYNAKTKIGIARTNVTFTDTTEKVIVLSNYAFYNGKTKYLLATKKPVLISILKTDSLYLGGDTLISITDTVTRYHNFYTFHHVKIYKTDMQGVCDSLTYSDKDSVFHLYHNPVLWVQDSQLKGDTILMFLQNKHIDHMKLLKNAFLINIADSIHYNQVKGKNMTGYFKDNELNRMHVSGNGESIYFAKSDSGGNVGVNKATCSNMMIYFKNKKVDHILFLVKPDAVLNPMGQVKPEDLKLKDFQWLGNRRPKSKKDLFE